MRLVVMVLGVSVFLQAAASAEHSRTKVVLSANMCPAFTEHIRHHMGALGNPSRFQTPPEAPTPTGESGE